MALLGGEWVGVASNDLKLSLTNSGPSNVLSYLYGVERVGFMDTSTRWDNVSNTYHARNNGSSEILSLSAFTNPGDVLGITLHDDFIIHIANANTTGLLAQANQLPGLREMSLKPGSMIYKNESTTGNQKPMYMDLKAGEDVDVKKSATSGQV